jgi:GNAT superfamily N-acetyltransferase
MIEVVNYSGDVTYLKPVVEAWVASAGYEEFGINLEYQVCYKTLRKMMRSPDGAILLLKVDGEPVGFLVMYIFANHIGYGKVAQERYFYIMPEYRGTSGVRLIREAEKWAKHKGANYFFMFSSKLAGPLYERTCALYERLGMKQMESMYCKRI